MRSLLKALLLLVFIIQVSGCNQTGDSFTLYRNSVTNENMRIHVASFDAADGEAYNRGNCEQAQVLFQAQQSVKVKFWCEKGAFKK
jgi:hypothetical protein